MPTEKLYAQKLLFFGNRFKCISPGIQAEKNLSFKTPKDDPSKPPLRLNIPDDSRPKEQQTKPRPDVTEAHSATLESKSETPVLENDFWTGTENELQLPSFASTASPTSDTAPKNDTLANPSKETIERISLAVDPTKDLQNDTEDTDSKSVYIIVDVPRKDESKSLEVTKHIDLDEYVEAFVSESDLYKRQKSENAAIGASKSLSRFPFLKGNPRHTKKFEITEIEDTATYVFHLKLNKSKKTRPTRMSWVPEKEITTRYEALDAKDVPIKTSDAVSTAQRGLMGKPAVSIEEVSDAGRTKKHRYGSKTALEGKPQTPQKYKRKVVDTILKKDRSPPPFEGDDYGAVKAVFKNYPLKLPLKTSSPKEEAKFVEDAGQAKPEYQSAKMVESIEEYLAVHAEEVMAEQQQQLEQQQLEQQLEQQQLEQQQLEQQQLEQRQLEQQQLVQRQIEQQQQVQQQVKQQHAKQQKLIQQQVKLQKLIEQQIKQQQQLEQQRLEQQQLEQQQLEQQQLEQQQLEQQRLVKQQQLRQQQLEQQQQAEREALENPYPYYSIHELKTKKPAEKSTESARRGQKPKKKLSTAPNSSERLDTETLNFRTAGNYVSIDCEKVSNSMNFGAAFPSLLSEALKTRLKFQKDFFFPDKHAGVLNNRGGFDNDLSDNSILFPKKDKFDCEALFTTNEEIIVNLINNLEEKKASRVNETLCSDNITEHTNRTPMDSLTVMKKVREIVQFDLDNVIKIFDGPKPSQELSSVVVLKGDTWEVDTEELIKLTEKRVKTLREMDFHNNVMGDLVGGASKYLPPKEETEMKLPRDTSKSVVSFNTSTSEFFINKEALGEAIANKTNEPYTEVVQTLDLLVENGKKAMEMKKGDSILVFDDETQSWKVDFSILEKREEQLRLERELTKRSELILETFEKLEKGQMPDVAMPETRDKQTFDYKNEQWNTYTEKQSKKPTKTKSPFKEPDAEEIRKKNSDMYENLFVVNKKQSSMNKTVKKAPSLNESNSTKKSKAVFAQNKESSGSTPQAPGSTPAVPPSKETPPEEQKNIQPEKEEENFWGTFLKMDILPRDIKDISKSPPPSTILPPKAPTVRTPKEKTPPSPPVPPLSTPPPKIPPLAPPASKIPSTDVIPPAPPASKKPSTDVTPPVPPASKKPSTDVTPPVPPASKIPSTDVTPPAPPASKIPSTGVTPPVPPTSKIPSTDITPPAPPASKIPSTDTPPKIETPSEESKKIDEPPFRIRIPFIKDRKNQKPKDNPPAGEAKTEKQEKSAPTDEQKKPGVKAPPMTPPTLKDDPKTIKPPPTIGSSKTPLSDKKTPVKGDPKDDKNKIASAPDHYVSDKIIEISRSKAVENGQPKVKTNEVKTVKLNITSDKRLPSKVTEINLNKKESATQSPVEAKAISNGTTKKNEGEKNKFYKKFEKYKTPFSEPDFEEKSVKIKSDIESNPNLKKLDNWNKTLVLHDIMKPPENIESWLKDETDKMATLLLKVLQEAAEGKPKKKQPLIKSKNDKNLGKGNPYDNIRKKQENTPENFLFRVRTVNLSLDNEKKLKQGENTKLRSEELKDIPVLSGRSVKPPKVVDAKVPEKDLSLSAKGAHVPVTLEDGKFKEAQTALETSGDAFLMSRDLANISKLSTDITEEIPGPEILKKISNAWKVFPILGTQMTIFTLLRMYQLVNMGTSILRPQNSNRNKKHAFTKLFKKYGPIVNVQGPLSGNVILIHSPEHLIAVFEQDITLSVRSVFDSIERVRRESEDSAPAVGISTDWMKPEWNELKRGLTDPLITGSGKYFGPVNAAADSLVSNIKRNRNTQNCVSDDFMEEIRRWSLEGLCNVLFEKSFEFLKGRTSSLSWVMEPDKLYQAVEEATHCLNKCERGFQMWRLIMTPSAVGLSRANRSLITILSKQLYQSEMNLKGKNEEIKAGNPLPKDLTFIESMLLNDGMTTEEIMCNLVDIVLIGTNMMSSAMGFLLYDLAQNVKSQMKLMSELKEVLPSRDSPLNYHKLISLKYLQACLKESLRLHFPVPVFYRLLQSDILLANYIIPKGTYVVMDNRVTSMKEQIFDDPDKFLPDRWLKDERWMQNIHPFSAFPLCHGPRSELAKKVLEMQMLACVAKIIRNFNVEYQYGEIQGTDGIISFPDKPLKLNFAEREQ